MGKSYKKVTIGLNVERSFTRRFWKKGIPAVRIPASGAATGTPRPDVILFSNSHVLCVELKTSSKKRVIYKKEEWKDTFEFSDMLKKQGFSSIPYLVFHPKGTRKYIWIEIPKEAYENNKKLVIEREGDEWRYYWVDD
ncbi:MAG: hypothetical protein DRN30_03515 [Thermoplasmata archaeon]|nr:MAG: hypothetical protein DRN30_03515 [Thermoplasmata archaeon]